MICNQQQLFLRINKGKKENNLKRLDMKIYSCIRLSADFSATLICLPFGSLNLQLPAVQERKVAVIPAGIFPRAASV